MISDDFTLITVVFFAICAIVIILYDHYSD